MKKIYLLLGLVSYQSFSQDSQKSTQLYNEITFTAAIKEIPSNEAPGAKVWLKKNGVYVKAYINNIPSAVMADFTRKYASVENISWKVNDNEVTGYFFTNNEKVIVTYKKNGHLVSTRKTYDSSKMTRAVKVFLQAEFNKGFRTHLVTEVVNDQVTLYEINLVNETQICVIRLSKQKDGEPELMERIYYTKVSAENI